MPPRQGQRFNAMKHGRYAASTFLPEDDPVQYQRERRALFHNYRPQTKDEADLVAMMAESRWGLQRYDPLQGQLDGQALSPETDAAARVTEPIAHERLHSGMDVTVQRQRLSRMWHKARAGLAEAQKMRLRGLVAGARKLPQDCYMEVDGTVYGPVPQPEIVPIPEPALEPDSLPASDSGDGGTGIFSEQKETGGEAGMRTMASLGLEGAVVAASPVEPPMNGCAMTDVACGTWAPSQPVGLGADAPEWTGTVYPFRPRGHERAEGQRQLFVPLWLSGLGAATHVGSAG